MTASENRLEELQEEYVLLIESVSPKSLDMARLEHLIWDYVKITKGTGFTVKGKAGGEMRYWFTSRYKGQPSGYETRATIFRAGTWAHAIFEKVDKELLVITAAKKCIHRARTLAVNGNLDPAVALKAILEQYDGTHGSIEKATIGGSKPGKESPLPGNGGTKDFKTKIMQQAKQFTEDTMSIFNVEPVRKQQIIEEFEASLSRILTDFFRDIADKKGQAKRDGLEKIGSTRFGYACEVLGLNAKFGKSLDIRRVNKAFRKRAAPLRRVVDVAVGNNDESETVQAARDELEAVNEAYELLRMYVKQKELGKHGK